MAVTSERDCGALARGSRSERVLLLDGGLATELERRGHDISKDPLWSARLLHSDPEAILEVHKSYLESGADILITASYQASVAGFCSELGVSEDEALDLIGQSVSLAKEARRQHSSRNVGRNILIAGSVGPYGACQHDGSEYTGSYVDHMTKRELQEWHRPRVRQLVNGGADLLACETLPALEEALAVADLLRNDFPATRAWLCFSCRNGTETCHGEVFREVVEEVLAREQIVAVGVNCSDPGFIEPLLRSCSDMPETDFVAYPNSGETWDSSHHCWTGRARDLSSEAVRWMELGARFVGGCCRVGPADIKSLRHRVDLFSHQLTFTH